MAKVKAHRQRGRTRSAMADRIYIQGLGIDCLIGFADWERLVKQKVVLDLWVECEVRQAARVDQPRPEFFNTKALSKRLQAYVAETEFNLIETLAERICELALQEFPISAIGLRLSKPGALRGARNVAVRIRRTAKDYPL